MTCMLLSARESYKDVNCLHLPNERFSPVRRASDGMASINKYQSHLEKLYHQTLSQPSSRHSSLKALQAECQQLQISAGSTDAEKQLELQQGHALHRMQQLVSFFKNLYSHYTNCTSFKIEKKNLLWKFVRFVIGRFWGKSSPSSC